MRMSKAFRQDESRDAFQHRRLRALSLYPNQCLKKRLTFLPNITVEPVPTHFALLSCCGHSAIPLGSRALFSPHIAPLS
jgi:hypothetical protein